MANTTLPLDDDGMYHIYNRAVGNEVLFINDEYFLAFLKKIEKYILPHVDIWSYCLLPNHFHLLIKLKANATGSNVSKGISDCCNAYVKWINTLTKRKGNLFMRPFKRSKITDDNHLAWIIWYIHRNPVHHHLTSDYSTWKYSSYNAIAGSAVTKVARNDIYDFFGGLDPYLSFHKVQQQGFFETLE